MSDEALDSLDIAEPQLGDGTERKTVEDGTYAADYVGFRAFMDDTKWGKKKAVKLRFNITQDCAFKGTVVSFKGLMFESKETKGKWIIGSKSKLADKVRKITKGKTNLNKDHEGCKVYVEVETGTSKKLRDNETEYRRYDFVKDFLVRPPEEQQSTPPAQQPSQAAAEAPAAGAVQKKNEDLMGGLDDFSLD